MRLAGCATIKSLIDQQAYEYELRFLNGTDLWQIMELQEKVISGMDRKDYCVPLSAAEHLEMLNGQGEAVGVLVGPRLIALCGIVFPGITANNIARELSFSEEKLKAVAQLEIALVDPEFQENDLQQKMAGLLAQRAESDNRWGYLFTTVSPYNYPSLQTVAALGMRIAKVCKKYFEWDRYVVFRDFFNPTELDTAKAVAVTNTALSEQQALLERGYLGFSPLKDEDGLKILFAKEVKST